MGLWSSIKGMLGGGGSRDGETGASTPDRSHAVEHKGYLIIPAPRRQGGQYLTAGIIETIGGEETKTTEFVRADTFADETAARDFAIIKGRQIIDFEGDRLFS